MKSEHLVQLTSELARWLAAGSECGDLRLDEPLLEHSSWRIGGPADLMVVPKDVPQLERAVERASTGAVPWLVIGEGSNLLFDDAGVRGVVIKVGGALGEVRVDATSVSAQAGAQVPVLARLVAQRGLSGIEHTAGIPGTLGGLIYMNGGSLRRSIGECVRRVTVVRPGRGVVSIDQADCGFGYRTSVFQRSRDVIVSVDLELTSDDPDAVLARNIEIIRAREAKFPVGLPNCGSVFKNAEEIYPMHGSPGKVIADTGLKDTRVGAACVSAVHANFIVNLGGATSQDVSRLIAIIREQVYARIGHWLECEVRYVAPNGQVSPAHESV